MGDRSAWCALEGRITRRVVPIVYSFVCHAFSSILLSLSLFLFTGLVSSGAVLTSVSSFFVSMLVRPSCLYMTDLGALDVRHGVAAATQRLYASCYQKVL